MPYGALFIGIIGVVAVAAGVLALTGIGADWLSTPCKQSLRRRLYVRWTRTIDVRSTNHYVLRAKPL